ncbi:hypothetical protein [Pseudarthrobacter oxydans]|uniref:hypothetical protein n=1 Tax=Pseudarthrobacter oxydans TaxID=1671 RepID=UPI00343952BF
MKHPNPHKRRNVITALSANPAAAFLRRAALLVGLLAIIAGIFGMHVMTGTHNGHSAAAVVTTATEGPSGPAAADGHHIHQATVTTSAHPATDNRDAANLRDTAGIPAQMCSCADCATADHAMAGSCIPAVKTVSLASPSSGAAVVSVVPPAGATGTVRGHWAHVPGTPSPGELSISRT